MFGSAAPLLPYVECSTPDGKGQLQVCKDKNVTNYPTWEFADESRLTGERALQELAEKTGTERSTVSHSLKVLKDCSYVKSEKSGKERIYSLTQGVLEGIKDSGEGHVFKFIDTHFQNYCNSECKRV